MSRIAPADVPFERALRRFIGRLSEPDKDDFQFTTLEEVYNVIEEIQTVHLPQRKMVNMKRIRGFLEAMEQYGKIIEVFLNTTNLLAFVWGPVKLLLQIARTWTDSLDKLLDAYEQINENIPSFIRYREVFIDNTHMQKVLELYYNDILEFHHRALKLFKRPAWKHFFHSSWKTFRTQFDYLISSLSRHKALVEGTATIATLAEVQQARAVAEERFKKKEKDEKKDRMFAAMEKIRPPNSHVDQEISAESRHETKTGRWLLQQEQLKDWIDSESPKNTLLWMNGIPGAGKSTLASLVIEEVAKRPNSFYVYFYCRHGDPDKSSFTGLLRGLLGQLLQQDNDLLDYVYEKCALVSETPLESTSFLKELLKTCLQASPVTFIILDGLDECKGGDGGKIALWFISLFKELHKSTSLRLLCVSQRDGNLDKILSKASVISVDKDTDDHKKDIESYTKLWSSEIQQKFNLNLEEEDRITAMVSQSAKGMFLYAKLVMMHLYGQTTKARLHAEISPKIFPKGLGAVYKRVVLKVFDNENTAEREDAIKLISWIVCAERPLKWRELQATFCIDVVSHTVDFEDRQLRVTSKDLCGSLVEIRSSKEPGPENTIELVHETARLYLTNEDFIDLQTCQAETASFCLQYLTFDCFGKDLSDNEIEDYVLKGCYAFEDYAVAHCVNHVLSAASTACHDVTGFEHLESSIRNFLQQHAADTRIAHANDLDVIAFFKICARLVENKQIPKDYLGLHKVLQRSRGALERLAEKFPEKALEAVYGPGWFKCPRPWCDSFHLGFDQKSLRDTHIRLHERPFRCTVPRCPVSELGYESRAQLRRHCTKDHPGTVDEAWKFPSPRESFETNIHRAASKGDLESIKRLVKSGENINRTSRPTGGETPLFLAVRNGHTDVVVFLLSEGANVNFRGPPDSRRMTALELSSDSNSYPMMKLLLNHGADPDMEDHTRNTLLCSAVRDRDELKVTFLLQNGANPDAGPHDDKRPLALAADYGQESMTTLLLKAGATATGSYGGAALLCAARSGYESIVTLLLEAGAAADFMGPIQQTPLSYAAENGHESIVVLLLEAGAAEDSKGYNWWTPLSCAAGNGYDSIVVLLLKAGAAADSMDDSQQTPLSYAAGNGHESIVALLLEAGAAADSMDDIQQTPLSYAADGRHPLVVKLLLEAGAKVKDSISKKGDTFTIRDEEWGWERDDY